MSFGTIRRAIHIESVFALSESENVAVFKRIMDNEQHSFLFRLCGQEVLYPVIPHIYSSVGYCIVYLIRVRHNLQIDRRNNLTLSLFYIDSTMGLGGLEVCLMCCIYDYQPFNFVYYKGEHIVQIRSVNGDFYSIGIFNENDIENLDNIRKTDLQPIPLNNTILEKCQFAQYNNGKYIFEYGHCTEHPYWVCVNTDNEYVEIVLKNNTSSIIKCENIVNSLHVLQNIVRGITGHLLYYKSTNIKNQ